MDATAIAALCESFAGVTADCPFGPGTHCYRVGGRIFASLIPGGVPGALTILLEDASIPREKTVPMLTLRCDPATGDFYRRQYPGAVLRPYHTPPAQQPYANTILLDGRVPPDALRDMAAHAYTTILRKLPKKRQIEIAGEDR